MAQKTSPFIESKYGWNFGESGWHTGMDENLLKFSYLHDRNVDGIVAELPTPPVNGTAYFNTTDNAIYFVVDGTYYTTPVPQWFEFHLRSDGTTYQFDGDSVNVVPSAEDLSSQFDALGTAAYNNTEDFTNAANLANIVNPALGANLIGYKGRTVRDRLSDTVSVLDYVEVGAQDHTAGFNNAASTGKLVYVPKGTWNISEPTTSGKWFLDNGAVISGLPNVGTAGGGVNDTSRLTGQIFSFGAGGVNTLRVGDSDPWLTRLYRDAPEFLAEFISVGRQGNIGGLFATRSGDGPTANMNAIAVAAFGVNSNTTNPEPSWSTYLEAVREANTGPAFNMEADYVNLGNTYSLTPYSAFDPYSSVNAPTVHHWLSVGGGDSALTAQANDISAVACWLPNGKKYQRGIVVRANSITSSEIISAPTGYTYTWYDPNNRVTANYNDSGISRTLFSDTLTAKVTDTTIKKKANGTSATATGDVLYLHNYAGWTGSANYVGGYTQYTQKTDFASSSARFSWEQYAGNSGGGFTGVAINLTGNVMFTPSVDNAIALGVAGLRWSAVYAGTGTINTSDEREKEQIQDIEEVALRAWAKVKYCQFKFKDAVKEKGDGARWHFGVIAQRVKEAFESEGLDPFAYGILCYDEWVGSPEQQNDEGEVIRPEIRAGNRYGIRYEEALVLECAYLRSCIVTS